MMQANISLESILDHRTAVSAEFDRRWATVEHWQRRELRWALQHCDERLASARSRLIARLRNVDLGDAEYYLGRADMALRGERYNEETF